MPVPKGQALDREAVFRELFLSGYHHLCSAKAAHQQPAQRLQPVATNPTQVAESIRTTARLLLVPQYLACSRRNLHARAPPCPWLLPIAFISQHRYFRGSPWLFPNVSRSHLGLGTDVLNAFRRGCLASLVVHHSLYCIKGVLTSPAVTCLYGIEGRMIFPYALS